MGLLAYLFSVTRVTDTDRYIIRSVSDQTKTLKTFSSYVVWETIPTDDSQVPEDNTFNLIGNNGALLIKEVGTGKYICGGGGSVLAATDSLSTQVLTSWRFRGYRSYIEDGVYSFENLDSSGIWINTENDSCRSNSYMMKKSYDVNPIEDFSRGGMFKINRIGNTDQYTIRPMTNNGMAWKVDNNYIVNQTLSINQTTISDSMKFHIAYDNGNYIIIPYNPNGLYMSAVSTVQSSDDLTVVSALTVSNNAKWKMYKYIGMPKYGGDIMLPDELITNAGVVGNLYHIYHSVWYTMPDACEYSFTITDGDLYTSNYSYYENSGYASFKLINPGYIQCNLHTSYEHNGFSLTSLCDAAGFNSIPKEDIYYIQNKETLKYLNAYEATGNEIPIIHQAAFNAESKSQWEIKHTTGTGGYVRIKSVSSGMYIGVDPDNPTIIRQYSTSGDNTLWRFEAVDKNAVKIKCKINDSDELSDIVLASHYGNNGYTDSLTQREYTYYDDCGDEWYIIKEHNFTIVNYYDMSVSNDSTYAGYIASANDFVIEVFQKFFGVEIIIDGAPTYFHTVADDCPLGLNVPCNDECSTVCRQHHKNLRAISTQIYNSDRELNHIYVLWSNRPTGTFCKDSYDGSHGISSSPAGLVVDKRPVAHILRYIGSTEYEITACTSICVLHEIMHTLGMLEVNDDPGHCADDSKCVMCYYDKETLVSFYELLSESNNDTNPFCDSCQEQIRQYINNIICIGT